MDLFLSFKYFKLSYGSVNSANIAPGTIHEIIAHLFQLNFTVFCSYFLWLLKLEIKIQIQMNISSIYGENKSLKNFTPRVADTRIKFIIKKIVISSFLFRAVVDDSFIY